VRADIVEPMTTSTAAQRFPFFRLLVITGAVFAAVTSEFLPTGLLPDMAAELKVSESQIGLLVTIFAGTVVLTTAPLTAVTNRFSRKWLMVLLLGVFSVANILAALAPSYEFLIGARILGGAAHGLFWAVTGPYASRLVPRHQLARAISVTGAGGTAAFILGVPIGTALGHALGWRLAFAVMAGVVLVFLALVVFLLPPVSHIVPLATGEIAVPLRRDRTLPAVVIVAVSVTLLIVGQNTFYTYIVPWAIQIGGVPPDNVSGLLFAYGAAGAIGLVIAGTIGDRYPRSLVALLTVGVGLSVAAVAVYGPGSPAAVVAGLVAWSALFGGLPSLFQTRMLHAASLRMRDTASAWLTIAFNLAIGLGALLGGFLLDGFGITVLPYAELVFIAAALVFILLTDRRRIAAHPSYSRDLPTAS
jgi:predicted MFS family arabinose efflux permease